MPTLIKKKSEISKMQQEQNKIKFGGLTLKTNTERKSFFTGTNEKNIGGSISAFFKNKGFQTTETDIDDFKIYWGSFEMSDHNSSRLISDFENSDILVVNHGQTHLDWIENQPIFKIIEVVENSLTSQMILLKKYVEKTIEKPYIKTVIFIGSMAHQAVLNGSSPYCAAKAGLNHFVRCASWELAPKGYRIFIINPSNVQDAPMSEETIKGLMRYRDLTRHEAESYWSDSCLLGNFLTKGEIAEICYNLTQENFKYLSGSPINLSGGQR